MQYYLKARFHFNKTQFADLMLIVGVAGTLSQVCLQSFSISSYHYVLLIRFLISQYHGTSEYITQHL